MEVPVDAARNEHRLLGLYSTDLLARGRVEDTDVPALPQRDDINLGGVGIGGLYSQSNTVAGLVVSVRFSHGEILTRVRSLL